jgi:hypothetical protein
MGKTQKKTIVFSQALMALRTSQRDSTGTSGGGGSNSIEQRRGESPNAGEEKTPFLLPFDCGERSFCQDRLGTVAIKKLTQTKRWLLSLLSERGGAYHAILPVGPPGDHHAGQQQLAAERIRHVVRR